MPALADQAQILRCTQRDRDVIKQIQEDLKDIFSDVLPNKSGGLNRLRTLHPIIAQLSYYYYTSLSKYQTLGEEYVGIVLSKSNLSTPSRFHLFCLVMLRIMGPYMMTYIVKMWGRAFKNNSASKHEDEALQTAKRVFIFREALAVLDSFRNGIFYYTGSFYDLAMWVTGIHYVLVRPWLKNEKILHYFKILGTLTVVYSIVSAFDRLQKVQRLGDDEFKSESSIVGSMDSSSYCYLCMEKRKNTSATPCGHLFCWNCIVDAVLVKNVCPLCREKVNPSRIVILKNYDN